jgi:hypothetical protein
LASITYLSGTIDVTLLWVIAGASLVAALVAWSQTRRTAKRLEQLSQMYWELKYQQGELRVQLQRATGELPQPAKAPGLPPEGGSHNAGGPPQQSFIPLASLKR